MMGSLLGEEEGGDKSEKIVEKACECSLCYELMYEPSTTVCGHSYCVRCLETATRHSSKCPTCRTRLSSRRPAVNATLHELLRELVPAAYAERREEAELLDAVARRSDEKEDHLGIFVLDHMLPKQHMKLHVFEDQYRRLVAHALEGNKTFGVAGYHNGRTLASVATECEIVDHTLLPDGRYLCQVVGRRRVRVLRDYESDDGYRVAVIEPYRDEPVAPGDRDDLERLGAALAADVGLWCDRVRGRGWASRVAVLDLALSHLGPMPSPASEPELFGLWVAALINPLPALGLAPEIRRDALTTTDSLSRLRLVHRALTLSLHRLDPHKNPSSVFALFSKFAATLLSGLARALIFPFALFARLLLVLSRDLLGPGVGGRFDLLPLEGIGQ